MLIACSRIADIASSLREAQGPTNLPCASLSRAVLAMTRQLFGVMAGEFPGFRVFPRHVNRVVKMQQKSFAAIEKSEAKDVVVYKSCRGPQDNVDKAIRKTAFF